MRPAASALLLAAPLLACTEPDTRIASAEVTWMEWPAEVAAGTPFPVRLVVFQPCVWTGFEAGPAVDQSAVTFAPFFLMVRDDVLCLAGAPPADRLVVAALDTVGIAPGLVTAGFSRTYEMRAAAPVYVNGVALSRLPIRTFGQVIARTPPTAPDPSRRNAGGYVVTEVDTLGCLRVRPIGAYRPGTALILENLTDTVNLSGSFVRGYIYEPAAPVCGEANVFHLVTRN